MTRQFNSLSCYEELEMQCALAGVSKIEVLKEIGHQVGDYLFFVSDDGMFNWIDSAGNHVEDPSLLKKLEEKHVPKSICRCIVPRSVTCIGECAFYGCKSLKEIAIPSSVTSISPCAFFCCEALSSIAMPDSEVRISNVAFSKCKSLKSVTVPESVAIIGFDVFYGCTSLRELVFKGKTLEEVKKMSSYPFGIADKSIVRCET